MFSSEMMDTRLKFENSDINKSKSRKDKHKKKLPNTDKQDFAKV